MHTAGMHKHTRVKDGGRFHFYVSNVEASMAANFFQSTLINS